MAKYDILWQMSFGIKWHMGIERTEFIRQIDLWSFKSFFSNKIGQKLQQIEMTDFPLYFMYTLKTI